jgi:hypothetical protein
MSALGKKWGKPKYQFDYGTASEIYEMKNVDGKLKVKKDGLECTYKPYKE